MVAFDYFLIQVSSHLCSESPSLMKHENMHGTLSTDMLDFILFHVHAFMHTYKHTHVYKQWEPQGLNER